MRSPPGPRRGLAPLAVAAAVVAGYWPLALGRLPGAYDIVTYALPNRVQATRALRHLHLPLWDPYRFAGVPFLANPQAAVLYPLHWLLVPFAPDRAMAVSMLAHLVLAALGAYAFARVALGCSRPAAALAGAAFGLSGVAHGQLEHYEQITSLAWLPWVLLAVDRAVARLSWRDAAVPVAALAAAVALTALAGHSQYLFIALAVAAVYAVAVARPVRRAARVAAGCALGLGLAAAQLLPTLVLARTSIRSSGLRVAEAAQLSLPRRDLFGAFLPDHLGVHDGSFEWWAWTAWAVLVLAAIALLSGRAGRRGAILAAIAAGATVLALGPGTPVFRVVLAVVPGADLFRVPARWLAVPSLALPLLAATGFDAVRLGTRRRRTVAPHPRVAAAIAALAIVELLAAGTHTPDLRHSAPPLAATVAVPAADGRVLPLGRAVAGSAVARRRALVANTQVFGHLRSLDGYDGGLLVTRRYLAAMRALTGYARYDPTASLRTNVRRGRGAPLDPARFAELDVTRVVADHPTFDVARALPPGSRVVDRVADGVDVWATPSHGPVFLADGTPSPHLRLVRDDERPERLVIEVPATAGGREVVVSEAWADGWTASRGVRLRLHRGLLTAFTAPAGGGRVVLRYEAPGLAAGTAISVAALAVLAALLALSRRRPSTR